MLQRFIAATRGALRGLARKMADGPFGLLRGIFPVMSADPPAMGTRDLLEGFDSMPWLRAPADKVALAVACTQWELSSLRRGGKAVLDRTLQRGPFESRTKALKSVRDTGQLRDETDHVFFDAVETPNPFMGRVGLLKITEVHLDLVGDAYWIKERNAIGTCVGFWPVPPHWVLWHPTPSRPSFKIAWKAWQAELPENEVEWFHEPAPANPYARGSGIGWTLGDEVEVDEYASKMAKALFFNQARPDFIVYGFEDDTEKRRFERDWLNRLQGFWRAHKPYFITGEPKFHEFQRPTMEQLVYPAIREKQRDIVFQTWGLPPEMFGILENSNRATIEASEYLFLRWVVLPRVERLCTALQRMVSREYDERLILHYASPVPEDKQFILQVAKAAPHSRKVDEWRQLQGLPPLGGQEGEAMLVPLNSRLTDDLLEELRQQPTPAPPTS